jgi:hypothetical protein
VNDTVMTVRPSGLTRMRLGAYHSAGTTPHGGRSCRGRLCRCKQPFEPAAAAAPQWPRRVRTRVVPDRQLRAAT